MKTIFAIDPGTRTSGFVQYNPTEGQVGFAFKDATVEEVVLLLQTSAAMADRFLVAIERVQSTGQAGADLLQTSEVVGRIQQAALLLGYEVKLVYRREVCRILDVSGGGKDGQVRQRMLEAHPKGVGTKKKPGPLAGVSSHAWQALGLAYAVAHGARDARGEG